MMSYTGELWPALGWMALTLAVLAALVGGVVWFRRRRGSRTAASSAALTISGWWLALTAIGMVIIVVKVFASDSAEFTGQTNVWLSWPSDLPCADLMPPDAADAGAALNCSGSALSDFTVVHASFGLRALAGGAQMVAALFMAVPAMMLGVISWQALRGSAFARVVPRALLWGAAGILVLGVASDLLGGIAATVALREVFPADSEWYPWAFLLTVTWWPFLAAVGLAALAAVFRQGVRLQADNDQLQDDTRGLV